ncbi:MAG: SDR family NAD(P)-dependent oxidoreductase [Rhodospirillales bacterium]|nr:SDR family NAD(P)-dependent oxidoreductase [Rhodospirillales bacterium]
MSHLKSPKSMLITGATSGIGAALAREYSEPGIFLALTGRDPERLAAISADCRELGAEVQARPLDVQDRTGFAAWIDEIDENRPIDLAIANAGVSGGTARSKDEPAIAREILAINVDGVLNLVLPLIPKLQERRRGQIAIMSSVAGFRGLATSPAYCASKAAVKVWGEGLRCRLWDDGIAVSVICPGWVKSGITDVNQFHMPWIMTAERAARIIRRGLAANKARICFPWQMHFLVWLSTVLPVAWTDGPVRRHTKKH